MFPKRLPMNRSFQEISHGVLYFSLARIFIDFVIFTCLSNRGKVWMENEKVSTEVVFNCLWALGSFSK